MSGYVLELTNLGYQFDCICFQLRKKLLSGCVAYLLEGLTMGRCFPRRPGICPGQGREWLKEMLLLFACLLATGESFNSMVATAATMLFWCKKPEISSFLHGLKACSSPCILQIFIARRRLPRHSVTWTKQPLDSPLLHPTDTHCGLFSSCSANQANISYLNTSIDIYFIGLLS